MRPYRVQKHLPCFRRISLTPTMRSICSRVCNMEVASHSRRSSQARLGLECRSRNGALGRLPSDYLAILTLDYSLSRSLSSPYSNEWLSLGKRQSFWHHASADNMGRKDERSLGNSLVDAEPLFCILATISYLRGKRYDPRCLSE